VLARLSGPGWSARLETVPVFVFGGSVTAMVAKPARSPATDSRPRREIRSFAGYVALVLGAVLLFLGWYGASGAVRVAEQIPYLASASIPGAALVIAGAVQVAADRTRHSNERTADMVEALYHLLAEAVTDADVPRVPPGTDTATMPPRADASDGASGATAAASPAAGPVRVGGGSRFHRPDCALAAGKTDVAVVSAGDIAERNLSACPICDPPTPAT
jgi:hypothetical protein